jgi:hypothetical protein
LIIWKPIWHKHVNKVTIILSQLLKFIITFICHFGSSILSFVYVEVKILGLSLLRDPYSDCVNSDLLKASLASRGNCFSFTFSIILAIILILIKHLNWSLYLAALRNISKIPKIEIIAVLRPLICLDKIVQLDVLELFATHPV